MTDELNGRPLIVGPGALGRLLAHSLAGCCPVTLAGRRDMPRRQALTAPDGRRTTRHLALVRLDTLPDGATPSVIHLTTKAYAAEAAADTLAARVAAGTPLVLWQNGFAVQPTLTERWPGPVLCASTTEGAYVVSDSAMVHAGRGESLIGNLRGRHAALAEAMAATLSEAGLAATAVDDIEIRLWQKLGVNAAINPLVALHEVPNGALAEARFADELNAVIAEIAAISAALGVAPPEGSGVAGWRRRVVQVIHATARNRASMLQDIDAGRPTEREAILGPLLRQAERHGVACPTLQRLDARLAAAEVG